MRKKDLDIKINLLYNDTMNKIHFDSSVFDHELDYFPLYDGIKPSSMGLRKMPEYGNTKKEEDKTFFFGESFAQFRKSKEYCRDERLSKYYQSLEHYPEIVESIVRSLSNENKEHFSLLEDQKFFTLNCHLTKEILVFNKKFL